MRNVNVGFALLLSFVLRVVTAAEIKDENISVQIWTNERAPTVIVAHGCSGDMPHYHDWAKQIADWGFNAIVTDSFTSRKIFNGTCGKGMVFPAERREEIYRIAQKVKEKTSSPVALIGFSHGGNLVLHVGVDVENKFIDAAVAYYPNCSKWGRKFKSIFDTPKADYKNPKIPVAVMYGAVDDWTPPKVCEEVVQGDKYETHYFQNATHAFDMNAPRRVVAGFTVQYNKEADEKSRETTKDFLLRILKPN